MMLIMSGLQKSAPSFLVVTLELDSIGAWEVTSVPPSIDPSNLLALKPSLLKNFTNCCQFGGGLPWFLQRDWSPSVGEG
jgi:hypothetical protein